MITVAIKSPYAANAKHTVEEHVAYARECMLDSLKRGEAPFASHLLYTQVWDDNKPSERNAGIAAGIEMSRRLDLRVFYIDFGWSRGMLLAKEVYDRDGFHYEVRQLRFPG